MNNINPCGDDLEYSLLYILVVYTCTLALIIIDYINQPTPMLIRKLAWWLLLLIEFDIVCVTLNAIKGQVVIDRIVAFPISQDIPLL